MLVILRLKVVLLKTELRLKKILMILLALLNIKKDCYHGDKQNFIVPYPGFKIFMMILYYFVVSLK